MRRKEEADKELCWDPGEANPKQKLFYQSRCLYTAYGGAKGGGKTHAVRVKAVGGALINPGIKILIMRQTYPALEENHIRPILRMLPAGIASYNGQSHILSFANGSSIRFGHWSGENSEQEYNGQEYDWIFMDEATQFTERAFNFLGGCLRGVNGFPKRMYLTCNPGGVGHNWVKRLFIDREYRRFPNEPERDEDPEDHTMIFATVEDNVHLLKSSPGYLKSLAAMPEDLRRAYRYGDWSVLGGNYFKEFHLESHSMAAFSLPEHWSRCRSIDYGLDMLACLWWAVDEDGRCWCVRELEEPGLTVSQAAARIRELSLPGEQGIVTFAPPDLWSRQKDSGKTMAELFAAAGVPLSRADNNRVQGHMIMKNMLLPLPLKDPWVKSLFPPGKAPAALPGLMFFEGLLKVMNDVSTIQADGKNPSDCAREPHELSHSVDAARYFCVSRLALSRPPESPEPPEEGLTDFDEYMRGSGLSPGYLLG